MSIYLDDGNLGGNVKTLQHDLELIESEGAEFGLKLNNCKTEVICNAPDIRNAILPSLPGARVVDPADATLLGSPIGELPSISSTLNAKTHLLKRVEERLQHLAAHDPILLLCHSLV